MSSISFQEASEILDGFKAEFETDHGSLHVIPEDRYDNVLTFLQNHFIPEEPVLKAFCVTWTPYSAKRFRNRLTKNLSLMMINKQNNEVMGVALGEPVLQNDVSDADVHPSPLREAIGFYKEIQKDINLFDRYGIDKLLRLANTGTHQKYRQMGVGYTLTKTMVEFARRVGFPAIKCEGDSIYSQKILEKLGFEMLQDFPYDSFIYEGEPLGNRTGIHRNTKLFCKRL